MAPKCDICSRLICGLCIFSTKKFGKILCKQTLKTKYVRDYNPELEVSQMTLLEYSDIKQMHIFCVLLSGALFVLRGALMLLKSPLSQHRVLKRATYLNDSILLVAGVTMVAWAGIHPVATPWLFLKLVLLVVYIVLGLFALRLAKTYRHRLVFFLAAVAVYAFMISVARQHNPWGVFKALL